MSPATRNLIIGASIGTISSLLTALLTAIVSHMLQMKRERRKRAWEVEDQRRERQRQMLKERLSQAEAWAEGYIRYIDEVQRQLMFGRIFGRFDTDEFREWMKEILRAPQEYAHRKASVYRLDDANLIELGEQLDRYWIAVAETLRPLREGHEVKKALIDVQLAGIWDNMLRIQGEFLARLDQIRTEVE